MILIYSIAFKTIEFDSNILSKNYINFVFLFKKLFEFIRVDKNLKKLKII